MRMNLLLVEPSATGHHMAGYTRLITRAAVQRGWRVELLTTASAINHPAFRSVDAEVPGGLTTFVMPEVPTCLSSNAFSLIRHQFQHYNAARAGFRKMMSVRPDMVFIVTLDNYEKMVALLGSPFGEQVYGGMLVNPSFHRRAMGTGPSGRNDSLYERLFRRMLRSSTFSCATVVDESFYEFAMRSGREEYSKVKLVPEIGELPAARVSRADARLSLGLDQRGFVILVYGGIAGRKGIAELLAALDHPEMNAVLLIAGAQYADVQDLLRSDIAARLRLSGRLIESNQFQNEEMEASAFTAADAVWLGYREGFYGSSGVLFQAASAGRPVLASDKGLIGWLTRRHKLGVAFDPIDPAAVRKAIQGLAQDSEARHAFEENGRQLAKEHTGAAFGRIVCDTLAAGYEGAGTIKVA